MVLIINYSVIIMIIIDIVENTCLNKIKRVARAYECPKCNTHTKFIYNI